MKPHNSIAKHAKFSFSVKRDVTTGVPYMSCATLQIPSHEFSWDSHAIPGTEDKMVQFFSEVILGEANSLIEMVAANRTEMASYIVPQQATPTEAKEAAKDE